MSRRCSIVLSTECTHTNTHHSIHWMQKLRQMTLLLFNICIFATWQWDMRDDVHCLYRTPECKRIVLQFISPLAVCMFVYVRTALNTCIFSILFFNKKREKNIFMTTRQRPRRKSDPLWRQQLMKLCQHMNKNGLVYTSWIRVAAAAASPFSIMVCNVMCAWCYESSWKNREEQKKYSWEWNEKNDIRQWLKSLYNLWRIFSFFSVIDDIVVF